jgi:hypothetical protein
MVWDIRILHAQFADSVSPLFADLGRLSASLFGRRTSDRRILCKVAEFVGIWLCRKLLIRKIVSGVTFKLGQLDPGLVLPKRRNIELSITRQQRLYLGHKQTYLHETLMLKLSCSIVHNLIIRRRKRSARCYERLSMIPQRPKIHF